MNKTIYLTISGICMALAGIILIASEQIGIPTSKILVPSLFAIGGVFSILFSQSNKQHKIAKLYHLIQGLGMVLFGVLIFLLPDSLADFLQLVAYFMLFFGLFEILFGFSALNLGMKLNFKILLSRFAGGLVNAIGAVVIISSSALNGLLTAGVLILIGGISFIIFSIIIGKIGSETE